MYKTATKITRDESALVAGNTLATHLCPIYHFLDLHFADADLVMLGEHQREFAILGNKANIIGSGISESRDFQIADGIGFPRQAALVHRTIAGMDGARMSASSASELHLDVGDTSKQTRTKIARSFCEPGNLDVNIAMQWAREFVLPLRDGIGRREVVRLRSRPLKFSALTLERSAENGGDLSVDGDGALLADRFADKSLHPADLKNYVRNASDYMNSVSI